VVLSQYRAQVATVVGGVAGSDQTKHLLLDFIRNPPGRGPLPAAIRQASSSVPAVSRNQSAHLPERKAKLFGGLVGTPAASEGSVSTCRRFCP
jgi:hypothetical protein